MSHFQEEIALLRRLGLDVDNRLSVISYEAAQAMTDELKQIIHNDRTIGAINPSYCIAVINQKKARLPDVSTLKEILDIESMDVTGSRGISFKLDSPDFMGVGCVTLTNKARMASKSNMGDYDYRLKIIEKDGVADIFSVYSGIAGGHLICALPASELKPMKDKIKALLAEPVQAKSPMSPGLY